MWDVGGGDKIRLLMRHYYPMTTGLIIVVDSNDRDRIEDVREEMVKMCGDDDLRGVPMLVFANKQDLPGAMLAIEIHEKLELQKI